jgi:hypothetical protein
MEHIMPLELQFMILGRRDSFFLGYCAYRGEDSGGVLRHSNTSSW